MKEEKITLQVSCCKKEICVECFYKIVTQDCPIVLCPYCRHTLLEKNTLQVPCCEKNTLQVPCCEKNTLQVPCCEKNTLQVPCCEKEICVKCFYKIITQDCLIVSCPCCRHKIFEKEPEEKTKENPEKIIIIIPTFLRDEIFFYEYQV
jgi:hypothetical protein